MKILGVEDNDFKFGLIRDFCAEMQQKVFLKRAASYQSGVEELVGSDYDFVLLDMSLPVSDISSSPVGNEMLTFGGEYILREISRRKIDVKVIVFTQYSSFIRGQEEVSFATLKTELLSRFGDRVVGCVRLDRDTSAWKTEIRSLLDNENTDN
jgi:CheY-like chemotaxis protein